MPTKTQKTIALTGQQHKAVALLATGQNGRQVAELVGVDPGTVSDWRKLPDFIAAYNATLTEAHQAIRDRLRSLATQAMDTIGAVLQNPEVSADTRMRAAFKIIELVQAEWPEVGSSEPEDIKNQQATQALDKKLAVW